MNKLIKIMLLLVLAAFCSLASAQEPDYNNTAAWAYWRVGENKAADLFIVCPTVDLGTDGHTNMSLTDENIKGNFNGNARKTSVFKIIIFKFAYLNLGIHIGTFCLYSQYSRPNLFSSCFSSNNLK